MMLDGAWRVAEETSRLGAGWGVVGSGGLSALGLYEALEFHSSSSLFFGTALHCTALHS
jgi:hypothetical protein